MSYYQLIITITISHISLIEEELLIFILNNIIKNMKNSLKMALNVFTEQSPETKPPQ